MVVSTIHDLKPYFQPVHIFASFISQKSVPRVHLNPQILVKKKKSFVFSKNPVKDHEAYLIKQNK